MPWQVLSRLPEVRAAMSPAVDIGPGMSAEEVYESLAAVEGLHVELLGGRVVVTGSASVRHNRVIWRLLLALVELAKANGWEIFESQSVHIRATRDRPRPDLAVVPPGAPQYDSGEIYADGVLLAVEVVSPSSTDDDRIGKPGIYAQGQVPLYLVIDEEAKPATVTLYSDPAADGYRTKTAEPAGEKLTLPEPFGIVLETTDLLK